MMFLGLFLLSFVHIQSLSISNGYHINQDIPFETDMNATLEGFASFYNIVIFIRFNDEIDYEAPYELGYYENMFNGVNQISLRDYYLEASYGKLDILSEIVLSEGDIYYYTDIYDRSYYEPKSTSNPNGVDDTQGQQAEREHNLLKRAINEVDALGLIDPALNLDVNNDGEIDSITFMISGEDNGWGSLLWPHKWELYDVYDDVDAPQINGIKAYTYTFNLLGNDRNYDMKASVGVLAHETFHLLGAPDLYHYYDFFSLENAGAWSLMDNSADTPVHMLGYMKETYGGWIEDVETVTSSGTYSLAPLANSDQNLLRIDTGYSNEYVYLEYRFQDGKYESTLPDSGLLIYRVDKDYVGNELGYANTSNGEGINEVFVFRPNIGDRVEPIRFPNDEVESFYGNLNQAAISNINVFKEAGTTTSFILFHSDGTLMDITITNVIETDGMISFDITMDTVLDVKFMIGDTEYSSDMKFIDHPLLSYEGTLVFDESYEVFYSYLDEVVDQDALQYEDVIPFDATHNIIHLAVYLNEEFQTTLTYEFEFVDVIETEHNPYGNMQDMLWYIPPIEDLSLLELQFNDLFELEDEYDYLYIFNDQFSYAYTGTALSNTTLDFSDVSSGFWILFQSDEYLDEYYGLHAEIEIEVSTPIPVTQAVSLKGNATQDIPYGDTYVDLGLQILTQNKDLYDVIVIESVDVFIPDTYTVIYEIYQDDVLIYTLSREVTVLEPITVGFSTIFDFNYELGSEPIDFDSLLFNVVTNGDIFDVIVDEAIDYDVVGIYDVTLTVKDAFGFESTQIFEVSIQDTTAPSVTFNASIDTIYVGDTYTDVEISYEDLSDVVVEITEDLNTEEIGVYTITYQVSDIYGNQTIKTRYIHVVENPFVQFHLEPTLTTLRVGETFDIPSCVATHKNKTYSCHVDVSSLNTLVIGDYAITYSVIIEEKTYSNTLYVFIVERSYKISEAILVKHKEDFL